MRREQLRQLVVGTLRDYTPGSRRQVQSLALRAILVRLDTSGRGVRMSHAQLGALLGRCARQVQTIVHRLAAEMGLLIDATAGYANTYRLAIVSELATTAVSSATLEPLAADSDVKFSPGWPIADPTLLDHHPTYDAR